MARFQLLLHLAPEPADLLLVLLMHLVDVVDVLAHDLRLQLVVHLVLRQVRHVLERHRVLVVLEDDVPDASVDDLAEIAVVLVVRLLQHFRQFPVPLEQRLRLVRQALLVYFLTEEALLLEFGDVFVETAEF